MAVAGMLECQGFWGEFMRIRIIVPAVLAACLCLPLRGTAAQAGDGSALPLSAWLAGCGANHAACIDDLTYGYEAAADDLAQICPPQGLDENAAAETELRWLENAAAADPGIASGKRIDAEWKALHTLWPCAK